MTRAEAWNYAKENFDILQDYDECMWYLKRIDEFLGKAEACLEVGVYKGGNVCMLSTVMDRGIIIGIDPHNQPDVLLLESALVPDKTYYHIPLSSMDKNTWIEVERILDGKKLDIAFLDGCHWESYVSYELKTVLPLMKDKAVIAIHDIAYGLITPVDDRADNEFTVGEWWARVKWQFSFEEKKCQTRETAYEGIALIFLEEGKRRCFQI